MTPVARGTAKAALPTAAAAAWSMPSLVPHAARLLPSYGIRTRLRDRRHVALTFDDGPQPGATLHLLPTLAELDVRATFFVVGEHAEAHPEIVLEILAAGHAVHSHGYRHRNHLLRNPMGIADDLRRASDVLEHITGSRPPLFRPPQGAANPATLRAARLQHQTLVAWSRWARDWRADASVSSIATEAGHQLVGGEIILLHDADWYGAGSWQRTRDAIPRIVDTIRGQGLSPVLLTDANALA